jgi:hypothetical protein|tara:strand:+ start:576 stop:1724 length:1149 start_codon:yes stop_codon:yes gene_type:complete
MTLNNVEAIFKDLASRHKQINSFYNQQAFDITSVDEVSYPSLVINTSNISLPKGDGGYSSKSYAIDLQVIDLVHKDESNKQEILSDVDGILNDIVGEFNSHPSYNEIGLDLVGDVTLNPLRNAYGDEVSGWSTLLTLEAPNKISWCGSPLLALDGFTPTNNSVIITDELNDNSPIIKYAGDTYTCVETSPKSGISYNTVNPTGQIITYEIGDDGWHTVNGTRIYTPPETPETFARLDYSSIDPFRTLLYNNIFGNKDRFTDINGLQVYGDYYIIDNLTRLAYVEGTSGDFATNINNANNTNFLGFSDYRVADVYEALSVTDYENSGGHLNYAPFNRTTDITTSTTRKTKVTNCIKIQAGPALVILHNKLTVGTTMFVRNHFN